MLSIAILGAGGRMGDALLGAVEQAGGIGLGGALVRPGSHLVGKPATAGVAYTDQPVSALDAVDAAIDFSLPEAFNSNLSACLEARCPVVIGTTGLSSAQHQRMRDVSHELPVLWSPNMSVGVNLCFRLTELAARVLGDEYDAEIVDIHHRHKRDAPSGTALRLGEVIATARGVDLDEVSEFRGSASDRPRHKGAIGFSAVRAGEVVGEHTVMFVSGGETVQIGHRAAQRSAFAEGALRAARWLQGRPAGLYTMAEVLGLKELP